MSNAMVFEDIAPKKASKATIKKIALKELDRYTDSQLVWHVVVRRKFGLLATFTIVYVSLTMFHSLIFGLIQGLK